MTEPTLSLCILTKGSGSRLAQLLADGRTYADEIVVGVDEASSDDTFEVATSHADLVFRFEHTGIAEHARLVPLELATGDWILWLDDDERMDGAFRELRPQFLADQRYTHFWFPRKWLVEEDPPAYLDALPWVLDWQLRLFRNDRRLVWIPPKAHHNYSVIGTGCHDDRATIVHYERVMVGEGARHVKVAGRRDEIGRGQYEDFYGPIDGVARAVLENPPPPLVRQPAPRQAPARVMEGITPSDRSPLPPWSAEISAPETLTIPTTRRSVVRVSAVNRGVLRWVPPQTRWPRLFLSYHVRGRGSSEVKRWDGTRTPVAGIVDPGESTRFLAVVEAPSEPGDYVLDWDLVSEGECWFAECGSATATTEFHVEWNELGRARTRQPSRIVEWASAVLGRAHRRGARFTRRWGQAATRGRPGT
jgi:hypothetical protein